MRYPSQTLDILLDQHEALRGLMMRVETLIDASDDDEPVEVDLARAVTRLRMAFEAHNVFEESLLRPLLLDADSFGPVRIDRMIDEHVDEHRAVRDGLVPGWSHDGLRRVLAS